MNADARCSRCSEDVHSISNGPSASGRLWREKKAAAKKKIGFEVSSFPRKRAEKSARETVDSFPENPHTLSPEEAQRLLHELQVRQIELEQRTKELRAAQQELEAVRDEKAKWYDSAPIGFFDFGRDGTIRQANLTGALLLGVARDALPKRRLRDFVAADSQPVIDAFFDRVFGDGNKASCDVELRRSGDETTWVRLEATVGEDGKSCRAVAVDITERVRAEGKLRKNEERFTLAMKGANDGWWDWDLAEKTIFFSPRWWEMIGYQPNELPSERALWDNLTHPDDRNLTYQVYAQAFRNKVDNFEVESRRRHKDGHWVPILTRGHISRDPSGKPVRVTGTSSDLTERKRVEAALRENEQHLRVMLENAADLVVELDLELNLLYVSPSAEPLTGYTLDEATALGMKNLLTPESLQKAIEVNRAEFAMAGDSPSHPTRTELEIRRKDGSIMFCESIARYLRRPDGAPYATVCVIRDFSERKRTEQALAESEERYRNLFEDAPLGIYRTTPDGRILLANPALVHMLGYSSFEELVSRNLENEGYSPHYSRNDFKDRIEKGGDVSGLESEWARRDGSFITVRESAKVVRGENGQILYYEGIAEDITERRRAEEALRESEERFHVALKNSPITVTTLDHDLRYTWVYNARHGFSPDTMIGRRADELIPAKDAAEVIDFQQEVLRSGIGARREVNGQTRGVAWAYDATAEPLRNERGEVVGLTYSAMDISERKRAEELLRESEENFKGIVENSILGLYRTTLDGRILMANSAFIRLLGYQSFEEVSGLNLEDDRFLASVYSRKEFKEKIEREGTIVGFEFSWRRSDGTTVFMRENSRLVRDSTGKTMYYEGAVEDITVEKIIIEVLRKNEALLNSVQELTKIGGWEWDVEKKTMFWTKELYYLHEFPSDWITPGSPKHIERSLECYDPQDRPLLLADFRRCAEQGEAFDRELPFTTLTGRRLWIRTMAQAVREHGRIVKVIGNLMDITERKQAEEEILSLAKFPSEHPDPIMRIDGDGTLLYVNEAGLNQLTDLHLQIGHAAPSILQEAASRSLADGLVEHFEFEFGERVFYISVAPIMVSGYANLYARDITKRKQAEREKQEISLRYHELANRISNGVAIYRARDEGNDFVFVDINPAGERLSAVKRKEITGRSVLEVFPGVKDTGLFDVFQRVWRTGIPDHLPSVLYRDQRIQQWVVNTVYKLPSGEIAAVYEDITERKQAEEHLRQYGELMQALVGHLEKIRESERTRMAREVHDVLGQNLTGLKMDLRWIERTLEELKPTAEVDKLCRRVAGASELVEATTTAVQKLAAELRPGVLDKLGLGPALQYEARRFQENTGIACEVVVPAESPELSPDKVTALFRIFQECLTNVARHAQATRVTADLRVEGTDVMLRVQDNGRGIQDADLASPHSLGLVGMEERATQFGGRVRIRRRDEGGTVVEARIPLDAPKEKE